MISNLRSIASGINTRRSGSPQPVRSRGSSPHLVKNDWIVVQGTFGGCAFALACRTGPVSSLYRRCRGFVQEVYVHRCPRLAGLTPTVTCGEAWKRTISVKRQVRAGPQPKTAAARALVPASGAWPPFGPWRPSSPRWPYTSPRPRRAQHEAHVARRWPVWRLSATGLRFRCAGGAGSSLKAVELRNGERAVR